MSSLGNKKQSDDELNHLNEGIIWKQNRQQHVRRRLIHEMKYGKRTSGSWMKRKLIPLFSLLLLIGIITTIFLSEFTSQEVADKGNDASHNNGDHPARLFKDDEGNNEKAGVQNNNGDEGTNDNETEVPNKDNDENNGPENTTNEKDEEQDDPQEESDERVLTEKEVINAIEGQITTDLDIDLPKSLPLTDGQHLTAVTSSESDQYEVTFYQHDEPIPLNNKLLYSDENPAEITARLTVKQYDTQDAADKEIGHEEFDENTGEKVKLGNDLNGYQDAGTGSVWTHFNIGRWALATQSSTQHKGDSETLAKDIVSYLQDHMLPAPQPNGFAHLDTENNDNGIMWQKGTTVYVIDKVDDPIDALDIVTDFQ